MILQNRPAAPHATGDAGRHTMPGAVTATQPAAQPGLNNYCLAGTTTSTPILASGWRRPAQTRHRLPSRTGSNTAPSPHRGQHPRSIREQQLWPARPITAPDGAQAGRPPPPAAKRKGTAATCSTTPLPTTAAHRHRERTPSPSGPPPVQPPDRILRTRGPPQLRRTGTPAATGTVGALPGGWRRRWRGRGLETGEGAAGLEVAARVARGDDAGASILW